MFLLVIRLVAPVDLATCSRVLFLPATLKERSTGFKTTGLADVVGCFSIGISLSGGVSVAVSSGDRSRHSSVERSVAVLSSDTGGDWSVERSVAVLSSDTGGDWSAGRSVAVLSSDTGGDWSAGRSVAVLSSDTGGDWSAGRSVTVSSVDDSRDSSRSSGVSSCDAGENLSSERIGAISSGARRSGVVWLFCTEGSTGPGEELRKDVAACTCDDFYFTCNH